MNEETQWQVILKRSKFWTFCTLLMFIILLMFMVMILRWWDSEAFEQPHENMSVVMGISFTIIMLVTMIVVFLLQLRKKWELIANEEGIFDYYSAFSRGQIYPRETIESITYKRSANGKSLSRRVIIRFSWWKGKKIFILPMLTWISFDIWDVKRSIIRYGNKNWNNISVNDYTKNNGIGHFFLTHGGDNQQI